jgi:hypothetical protein
MTSPLGPQIGGASVKLEMGICRVKKTNRLIMLTSVSLLMSTWKDMASSMVTVLVKGLPPGVNVEFSWPVSMMTGRARCSTRAGGRLEPTYT